MYLELVILKTKPPKYIIFIIFSLVQNVISFIILIYQSIILKGL